MSVQPPDCSRQINARVEPGSLAVAAAAAEAAAAAVAAARAWAAARVRVTDRVRDPPPATSGTARAARLMAATVGSGPLRAFCAGGPGPLQSADTAERGCNARLGRVGHDGPR